MGPDRAKLFQTPSTVAKLLVGTPQKVRDRQSDKRVIGSQHPCRPQSDGHLVLRDLGQLPPRRCGLDALGGNALGLCLQSRLEDRQEVFGILLALSGKPCIFSGLGGLLATPAGSPTDPCNQDSDALRPGYLDRNEPGVGIANGILGIAAGLPGPIRSGLRLDQARRRRQRLLGQDKLAPGRITERAQLIEAALKVAAVGLAPDCRDGDGR